MTIADQPIHPNCRTHKRAPYSTGTAFKPVKLPLASLPASLLCVMFGVIMSYRLNARGAFYWTRDGG